MFEAIFEQEGFKYLTDKAQTTIHDQLQVHQTEQIMSEITHDSNSLVGNASIHLECESLTITIILLSNSPAKSMCNLTNCRDSN